MDQPGQRCANCVVEIGIRKGALQLQPRNDPLNEDATLLKRYAVGSGPDGPKLRIGEGEHAAMVLPTRWMSIANPMRPLTSLPKRSEGRSRLSDQRIIVVQAQIGVLRSSVNCWTSLGLLLRPEIDIDIHSGDQRTGFVQVDHHLVDIEIGQIARSR